MAGYQRRTLVEVEVYVTFQVDGTNPVVSGATSLFPLRNVVAFVNSFLQGGSA